MATAAHREARGLASEEWQAPRREVPSALFFARGEAEDHRDVRLLRPGDGVPPPRRQVERLAGPQHEVRKGGRAIDAPRQRPGVDVGVDRGHHAVRPAGEGGHGAADGAEQRRGQRREEAEALGALEDHGQVLRRVEVQRRPLSVRAQIQDGRARDRGAEDAPQLLRYPPLQRAQQPRELGQHALHRDVGDVALRGGARARCAGLAVALEAVDDVVEASLADPRVGPAQAGVTEHRSTFR
mmetsp:Transcript_7894/g.22509  ORF Transcript_7894/g.22509 Transcript_7894/m.22509 type:complete len:240 (+) Transcript_7894:39-758(+)